MAILFRTEQVHQLEFSMTYDEFIALALHERPVNKAAHDMGIPQPTLRRYANGERLPDYTATLIMAKEASVSAMEALKTVALEDARRKGMLDAVKKVFRSLLSAAKLGAIPAV